MTTADEILALGLVVAFLLDGFLVWYAIDYMRATDDRVLALEGSPPKEPMFAEEAENFLRKDFWPQP